MEGIEMLGDIITEGETAYATLKAQQDAMNAAFKAWLAATYDSIVSMVSQFVHVDVRPYLTFKGDKGTHLYTANPFDMQLNLPNCAPIDLIIDARADVKFTLKVSGTEYPSLATAVGAAKAQG